MANELNKEKFSDTTDNKYYYEPWHSSMDKPMTQEQKKLVEERNKRLWNFIMSKQSK